MRETRDMACAKALQPAQQGNQGLSETGQVEETGPHSETMEGHSRSFNLGCDVFISPAEEHAAG